MAWKEKRGDVFQGGWYPNAHYGILLEPVELLLFREEIIVSIPDLDVGVVEKKS